MARRVGSDGFRGGAAKDFAAAPAPFRTQVDQPVGSLDDIEVVLDDDDGVAVIAQAVQYAEQQLDVAKVQAGRRLVEDVEGTAGVAFRQLERELDALRFAARKRRRALPEANVAEANVHERFEFARDRWNGAEELQRVFDRHVEHFEDRLALVADFQRLTVVALAVADVARHVHVGQEVHLDLDQPVALAGFAAPALDVEREAPRPVAARTRFGHAGKKFAHGGQQAGVRRRIRARRPADRRLVDTDDLVEELQPVN
ncbi:hypothetical protein ebB134 [Aromatoleum aromaticum EbN1]|uniref:Uncharacterized protein n=1 Tax=Aromatoleum aromaticum (strain DSM 19018 / LMG 30748 / EbN1) TaxID=76114 RepID=Q5P303_AROAE|nr:hypothetical protein ebB134 [Aromatoleum aromaticum EbN1]